MSLPKIIQDAQDNWPEDEASSTADSYDKWRAEDASYAEGVLHRAIAHMHKVFSFEDDSNSLVARYNAALLARGIDVKARLF